MENFIGLIIIAILFAVYVLNRTLVVKKYKETINELRVKLTVMFDVVSQNNDLQDKLNAALNKLKIRNLEVEQLTIRKSTDDITIANLQKKTTTLNNSIDVIRENLKQVQRNKNHAYRCSTMYLNMLHNFILKYTDKKKPIVYNQETFVKSKYTLKEYTYFTITNELNITHKFFYMNGVIFRFTADIIKLKDIDNTAEISFTDSLINAFILHNAPKYWVYEIVDTNIPDNLLLFTDIVQIDDKLYNCKEAVTTTEFVAELNVLQFGVYKDLLLNLSNVKANFVKYNM